MLYHFDALSLTRLFSLGWIIPLLTNKLFGYLKIGLPPSLIEPTRQVQTRGPIGCEKGFAPQRAELSKSGIL